MKWKSLQMPKEIRMEDSTMTDKYTKFIVEPLERGFGLTMGNALRRTLLSSIQGAAPVALRIDGILHEFSTIPGVYEDVTEIVLNVKRLRLKHNGDELKTLILETNKKRSFSAKDIETNGEIEILNPDLHLVKITEDAKFKMEIDVGVGRSYVPAEQNKRADAPVGTIFLDSLFSPVLKVNFTTENTRVGQRTDYDRLILEIWTDGSLTPEDALCFASKILKDHFQLFIKLEEELEMAEEEVVDEETLRIRNLLNTRVDELELSVRSSNCLRAANIQTLEELVQKTEAEMLKYRNFGRKSLTELNTILSGLGLSFGMDVSKYKEPQEDE
ncbi:MAG: DNA-directed RNA polymerase subunit alpha [candidate division Zixibacteria bacterium]|nr:DNA-directed RNA polymerase subunit alpha [candidate division Zixibacteria bacterium]